MVKSHNIIMCVPVTHTYTHALELYIRGITHQIKIALQVFFFFHSFFLGVVLPGVCVILVDFHTKQPVLERCSSTEDWVYRAKIRLEEFLFYGIQISFRKILKFSFRKM